MLPIPQQLEAVPAKPQAAKGPVKAESSGDEFARILQSQDSPAEGAEAAIPPELAEQAVQQLRDGVPLKEVLARLREQLRELAASLDAPFSPVQAQLGDEIAETLELGDDALLARLGLRQLVAGGGAREQTAVMPAQLAEDAEADPDLDLPEQSRSVLKDLIPGKEEGLGKAQGLDKERFELLGRLQLADRGAQGNGTPNLGQSASLRALEMSPVFKDVIANTAGQAKPLGEALALPQRVGEQGWGQGLAQRVMWLVGNKQQSAELKLNPAHMGPLEIKVTMKNDQASVALMANNAVVKEALEQALPRLRDMFNQQDIQLVQVDVGQRQDPRQAEADAHLHGGGQGGGAHDDGDLDGLTEVAAEGIEEPVQQGLGLVDAYA